ncbi:hypothetical protein SSBG_01213 [Streptomyces sp. SPB074]|nr:hypothetical protein SSBG_01213 [Streptomyces sp. SPB074]
MIAGSPPQRGADVDGALVVGVEVGSPPQRGAD